MDFLYMDEIYTHASIGLCLVFNFLMSTQMFTIGGVEKGGLV